MARTNNLSNFLTDVASAIKSKKGSNTDIIASNFDTEIMSIQTGGNYQEKTVSITQNGTQTVIPDTGYDAIDELTINTNVPLQTKNYTFTQNTVTTLTPEQGYQGFNEVGITVNVTGGTDTSDATAIAGDIKQGETAYVSEGKVTGTLNKVDNPEAISGGYNGVFFKPSDAISSGSSYYGCYTVTGTFDEEVGNKYLVNWVTVSRTQSWYIENQQKIKVGMPYSIVANKIGLTANKIKNGETILNVTGTYTGLDTSDATATANDIAIGKTAYVNGTKVTGTLVVNNSTYTEPEISL